MKKYISLFFFSLIHTSYTMETELHKTLQNPTTETTITPDIPPSDGKCYLWVLPRDIQNLILEYITWPEHESEEHFHKRIRRALATKDKLPLFKDRLIEKWPFSPSKTIIKTKHGSLLYEKTHEKTQPIESIIYKADLDKPLGPLLIHNHRTSNFGVSTNEKLICYFVGQEKGFETEWKFKKIFVYLLDKNKNIYHIDLKKFIKYEGDFRTRIDNPSLDKKIELIKKGYRIICQFSSPLIYSVFKRVIQELIISNDGTCAFTDDSSIYVYNKKTRQFEKKWDTFSSFSNDYFEKKLKYHNFVPSYLLNTVEVALFNHQSSEIGFRLSGEIQKENLEFNAINTIRIKPEPLFTFAQFFAKKGVCKDWKSQAEAWKQNTINQWLKTVKKSLQKKVKK